MSAAATFARHAVPMATEGATASGSVGLASSTTQSGPPYFCPTCQTSYSRLEYLRRHERRHADIRPFVCDCGKGFSRSDVLSRHKRQCTVVLNGGEGDESGMNGSVDDLSTSSIKTSNGGKRASTSGQTRRKSSTTSRAGGGGGKATTTAASRKSRGGGAQSDSLNHTPDDDDDDDDEGEQEHSFKSPHFPRHNQHHLHASGIPSSVATTTNSFPFPAQPGVQQMPSAPPPLLPPAPYGSTDGGMMGAGGGGGPSASAMGQGNNNMSFSGMMPSHHLSAFNNLVNQQHHYPSSPESNGTLSQHSSPRFSARDMSRHGSNGSRSFSLRKGGSFDHIGPRNAGGPVPGTTPNQYAPEFWDALDPAAKNANSMAGSDYISAGAAVNSLGDPSNSSVSGGVGGLNGGVTTPRGEPHRFSVSTGPLSPFSTIALTSTMSPYLNAFSNARDTPFVASPSRGLIPGTPGSSLNVFDWTMRPPSKPASSTMAKRDSLSQGSGANALGGGGGSQSSQGGGGGGGAGAPVNTSPSTNKRKREDDEGSRKSPKVDDELDAQLLDDDHRSAAELLDSLRTAGARPSVQTPGAMDASTIASSLGSVAAPVSTIGGVEPSVSAASALPIVSSVAQDEQGALAAASNTSSADVEAIKATAKPSSSATTTAGVQSVPEATQTITSGPLVDGRQDDGSSSGEQARTDKAITQSSEDGRGHGSVASITSTSPPPHNLTLSQLPVTASAPTSAAGLAQSSWEALMNGNGWTTSVAGNAAGLTSNASSSSDAHVAAAAPVKLATASGADEDDIAPSTTTKITPQRSAHTVGDDAHRRSP